ncbi:hypothetical protein AX15_003386 [Amanita polypyramis BW_CC]|nr:hypothetical protein AX15_003386 [Amanita polypyramis BW_CC]
MGVGAFLSILSTLRAARRAFSTNEPLPSSAQIAGVSSYFGGNELEMGGLSQAVNRLIDTTRSTITSERSSVPVGWLSFGDVDEVSCRLSVFGAHMVLTRRERWRRSGVGEIRSNTGRIDEGSMDRLIFFGEENHRPTEAIRPHQRGQTPRGNETQTASNCCVTNQAEQNDSLPPNSPINGPRIRDVCGQPTGEPVDYLGSTAVEDTDTNTTLEEYTVIKDAEPEPNYEVPRPTGTWHETNITAFAKLRLKSLCQQRAVPELHKCDNALPQIDESSGHHRIVPPCIFNHTTLQLPPQTSEPKAAHRYMASIDVLQKQMLVRALREPGCSVDLVERVSLNGADVIIDPFTAVLYSSLFLLPTECEDLIGRISKLSWSFQRLVIVLEAYPPACAMRASDQITRTLYAYTPPILKSIKKLRRGVEMAAADLEKRAATIVLYAFPNTLQEAASITRCIGDMAEDTDLTKGLLWGERPWLDYINEVGYCHG